MSHSNNILGKSGSNNKYNKNWSLKIVLKFKEVKLSVVVWYFWPNIIKIAHMLSEYVPILVEQRVYQNVYICTKKTFLKVHTWSKKYKPYAFY